MGSGVSVSAMVSVMAMAAATSLSEGVPAIAEVVSVERAATTQGGAAASEAGLTVIKGEGDGLGVHWNGSEDICKSVVSCAKAAVSPLSSVGAPLPVVVASSP